MADPGTEKWEDIDRFLQEEGTGDGQKLSFTELVKKLIAGEGREAGSIILAMVQNTLWAEIRQGGQMAGSFWLSVWWERYLPILPVFSTEARLLRRVFS